MTLLATLLLSTGVTIVLPSEAHVAGTTIVLGEIADVVATDVRLARAVETVAIGYAPAPGYSRLLHNHQIGVELRKAFPDVTWTFKGQPSTRVWPLVHTVAGERIADAARAEVGRAANGLDVEFDLAAPVADLRVPGTGHSVGLRAQLDVARLSTGGLSVPVDVLVDGETYRTIYTTWDVRVWQELPVVGRTVEAGEVLTASLFETRRVLLDGRTSSMPVPMDLITGSTAARHLRQGQIVTDQDVHRPVAVRAGDQVFVEVVKGAISARVIGTAIDSGALRDRILIRLDGSGREMLGTIQSAELVRVQLGLDGR